MKTHRVVTDTVLAIGVVAVACAGPSPAPMMQSPPKAKVIPHQITVHGDTRAEDYYWLRDKDDPAVVEYLEAENAYAEAVLAPRRPLQEKIYDEILGRIEETDFDVPVRLGDHHYYSRTEEGKQYRIYCRKRAAQGASEEVILDLNAIGEGLPFVGLGDYAVSDDGNSLAYSIDSTGFRQYQLRFKDLLSGESIGFEAPRVTSVAWAADHRTVFFVQEDEVTKRSFRLYRQRLDAAEPELVYEEADERFRVSVRKTRSRKFIVASIASHTTSEVRLLEADDPAGELRLMAPRVQDQEYYVDHKGDRFFVRTNDTGRNFRLASVGVDQPSREHWATLQAHSDQVMITGVDVFETFYLVSEREAGLPQMRIVLASGEQHRVAYPEAVYSASMGANPEFTSATLRYHYQSLVTPPSVYDYDVATRQAALKKRTPVLGDYDPGRYTVARLQATARDGTEIPVSMVYLEGTARDGERPVFVTGYGAYGISYPVSFSHARVSLLDRGVVCAIAHVRGGGELGKAWHDDGRLHHKLNSFTDFIDVAEFLIAEGWTKPSHLACEGGSAGGLLVGAVANMRPDLFKCVISHVPFADVLTTMLDEDLPLTVGEFEEWGNPKIAADYADMRQYCPYSNLRAQAYPAMLVKTSFNDSQVLYWGPAKYVAQLRALKTDDQPLLFLVNLKGGHGGSSGRYDRFHEVALDYSFLLWQLGVVG